MSDAPFNECLQLEELHIVSDLHLGGTKHATDPRHNFQIFDRADVFSACVDRLLRERKPGQMGFVVNGDLVDFLAEPNPKCFDPFGAEQKLMDIAKRPEFVPVWDSLRKLAGTPDVTLVIVLGNHDIELALPCVRRRLLQILSNGNAEAQKRVHLVFDGTGFRCRVGKASVLCLHGNEVDEWNYLDYEKLREIARDIHIDRPVADWTPNGGSELVIEVMNHIKKRFPFIDLLKPESVSVLGPTLMALDHPSINVIKGLKAVKNGMEAFGRFAWANVSRPSGMLTDVGPMATARQPGTSSESDRRLRKLLGEVNPWPITTWRDDRAATHLCRAESNLRHGLNPLDLITAEASEAQLGRWEAIWAAIKRNPPHEVLRLALERLISDQSFEVTYEDNYFKQLDEAVGADVQFLIIGHTHFERAIVRPSHKGIYFNSGTWVRRIRFQPAMLASEIAFKPVFAALNAGTMQALDDEAKGTPNELVLRTPTVVSIWKQGNATRGKLRHATLNGFVDASIEHPM